MIGRPEPGIRPGALVPRMGEMGITITRAVPGHVVAEVGMDGNANHLGTMHAGTLFGVAEVLAGVIALSLLSSGCR